jgi:hypothetical protein|tara:strand:+ start:623 stop:1159 length:537 start_codon:yes stop_codon:yes gene_type:complete
MYIKSHLVHKTTGIGATSASTYNEQLNYYQEPSSISGINILHRLNYDDGIPYFLCTATDDFNVSGHSSSGVSSLTSTEWNNIINTYDSEQENQRYIRVREMRDNALNISDIYVIKQVECNVAITTEFRTWRQELRDLPNGDTFPINWPTPPSNIVGIITSGEYQDTLKTIYMINDPIV